MTYRRAAELSQAGKPHDAELVWRQLAQTHPTMPKCTWVLEWRSHNRATCKKPRVNIVRALAINPRLPDVSFNLGLAEFKQGHFAAAIKPLIAAAKENPQDKRSGLLIGMSYFGLHNYAKATPYLQAAAPLIHPTSNYINVLAQSCFGARNMPARWLSIKLS